MDQFKKIHEVNNARKAHVIKSYISDDQIIISNLEKGKRAQVGEIREWKESRYQKTATGWKKVAKPKEMKTENFVDEDTGEEVTMTYEVDKTPAPRTDSPSQKRRERKEDAKESRSWTKERKVRERYEDAKEEYADLKQEMKQLDSDMNAEAGQMGDKWSDDDANRYGGEMNKLQTKIDKKLKEVKRLKADWEKF